MPEPAMPRVAPMSDSEVPILDLLRCPVTGAPLTQEGDVLRSIAGSTSYRINDCGIPLFAESALSDDALIQRDHYEKIAQDYVTNLGYPHTLEYMTYLDRVLLDVVEDEHLGTIAELCCGH